MLEQNRKKHGEDTQMPNRFYIPDKTWALDKKSNFDKFMQSYIKVLQREFKKVEVKGNNYSYSYYTCGQSHDSRNPAWEPFKILGSSGESVGPNSQFSL